MRREKTAELTWHELSYIQRISKETRTTALRIRDQTGLSATEL